MGASLAYLRMHISLQYINYQLYLVDALCMTPLPLFLP